MTTQRKVLIRNGQVVTGGAVLTADVLVEGERIAGVFAPGAVESADQTIDAAGCYVLPGVVDAHTHIALDTGIYRTADNWEIGTRAAAFGGVTTVIDFANQIVGEPYDAALGARCAEAAGAVVDYTFHMVVLRAEDDPESLRASLRRVMDLGLSSIKLFTTYRPNYYVDDATILRIFRAMPDGMIAMMHCENDSIVTDATQRLIGQGRDGWAFHGQSRPAEAEAEAVRRVVYLAGLAGARVYIVHNSTLMATAEVQAARQNGQAGVFNETCPQYLLLDERVYGGPHPEHYILQPPLRERVHAERLTQFVIEGAVDVLSTDSCDYSLAQKQAVNAFPKTPGGLPGLETLLPLMYTQFAETLGLPRLMQLLAENPARLFGLYPRKGTILPGSDADVVIYDPAPAATIQHADLHYVAAYSPFEAMPVQGRVRTVLSRGAVIVDGGEFTGGTGRGRFLPGGASIDPR